jgi:hypothetical protein
LKPRHCSLVSEDGKVKRERERKKDGDNPFPPKTKFGNHEVIEE